MLHFPEWQTLGVLMEGCHADAPSQGDVALFMEELTGSGRNTCDCQVNTAT